MMQRSVKNLQTDFIKFHGCGAYRRFKRFMYKKKTMFKANKCLLLDEKQTRNQ